MATQRVLEDGAGYWMADKGCISHFGGNRNTNKNAVENVPHKISRKCYIPLYGKLVGSQLPNYSEKIKF